MHIHSFESVGNLFRCLQLFSTETQVNKLGMFFGDAYVYVPNLKRICVRDGSRDNVRLI